MTSTIGGIWGVVALSVDGFWMALGCLVAERVSLSRIGHWAEGEEGSTEGNIICLFLRILLSPFAPSFVSR